jgi:hypothetical protein
MKIYIEVSRGAVQNVYTDNHDFEGEIILCDHDNALAETEGDGFDFASTKSCEELNNNREALHLVWQ